MLQINSVTISTPSEFTVGVYDITKAERNANGKMIIEKITTKRKLELTYSYLSNANLSTLLSAIAASITFTVTYPDPVTGAARTGTFYCGDRSVGMIDYQSSTPRWQKVKFNFIET